MFSFQEYLSAIAYIALSGLLFFIAQTWQFILASSALTLLVFAVASLRLMARSQSGKGD